MKKITDYKIVSDYTTYKVTDQVRALLKQGYQPSQPLEVIGADPKYLEYVQVMVKYEESN